MRYAGTKKTQNAKAASGNPAKNRTTAATAIHTKDPPPAPRLLRKHVKNDAEHDGRDHASCSEKTRRSDCKPENQHAAHHEREASSHTAAFLRTDFARS